jgi:hypothetical protein
MIPWCHCEIGMCLHSLVVLLFSFNRRMVYFVNSSMRKNLLNIDLVGVFLKNAISSHHLRYVSSFLSLSLSLYFIFSFTFRAIFPLFFFFDSF